MFALCTLVAGANPDESCSSNISSQLQKSGINSDDDTLNIDAEVKKIQRSVLVHMSQQPQAINERLSKTSYTSSLGLNYNKFFSKRLNSGSKLMYRKVVGKAIKELVSVFVYDRINRKRAATSSLDNSYTESVFAFIMDYFLTNIEFLISRNIFVENISFKMSDYTNQKKISNRGKAVYRSRNYLVESVAYDFIDVIFNKKNNENGINNFISAIFLSDLLPIKYRIPDHDMTYNWTWLVSNLDTNFGLNSFVSIDKNKTYISNYLPFDSYQGVFSKNSSLSSTYFSSFFLNQVLFDQNFLTAPKEYMYEWASKINLVNNENIGLSLMLVEFARAHSYLELGNDNVFLKAFFDVQETGTLKSFYFSMASDEQVFRHFSEIPIEIVTIDNLLEIATQDNIRDFFFDANSYRNPFLSSIWNISYPHWRNSSAYSNSVTENLKTQFNLYLKNFLDELEGIQKPKNFDHFSQFALSTTLLDPLFLKDPQIYLKILKRKNLQPQRDPLRITYTQYLIGFLDSVVSDSHWNNFLLDINLNLSSLYAEESTRYSVRRSEYWTFDFKYTDFVGRDFLNSILVDWHDYLLNASVPNSIRLKINSEIDQINKNSFSYNQLLEFLEINNSSPHLYLAQLAELHNYFYETILYEDFAAMYSSAREQRILINMISSKIKEEENRKQTLLNFLETLDEVSMSHINFLTVHYELVQSRFNEIILSYDFLLGGSAYFDRINRRNVFYLDENEIADDPVSTIVDYYIFDFLIDQTNAVNNDLQFRMYFENITNEREAHDVKNNFNDFSNELRNTEKKITNVEYTRLILKYLIYNPVIWN